MGEHLRRAGRLATVYNVGSLALSLPRSRNFIRVGDVYCADNLRWFCLETADAVDIPPFSRHS